LSAASINNQIGKRFIELLSVDSTNNYAMQQAKSGLAQHGYAYFAHEQTAGRGQFNKQWLTEKNENVILSVVIDTSALALTQQFVLNMIVALSVMELLNKYTTEKIKIKWPNDIYCRDRKAAGILIENIIQGKKWQFAIAGFGININQTVFDPVLKNPISLKQLTGKNYNTVDLAKELCAILNQGIQPIFSGKEDVILKRYNNALYKQNEVVKFKQGTKNFAGKVKHVDAFGKLIIESGIEQSFENGQIEWVIK